MAYGSVLGRNTKPQFVPTFAISGPLPGDTVTVSYGGTTVEAVEDNGVWYAKAWAYGSYTVRVGSKSTTVNVDEVKLYEVTLNGTVGDLLLSNYTTYCFILGFNHNAELEGNNTIHFQFGKTALSGGIDVCLCDGPYDLAVHANGYFSMNSSLTNSGGWASSQMRTGICGTNLSSYSGTIIGVIPAELRATLKAVAKYTDNTGNSIIESAVTATTDYFFLLSAFEASGTIAYGNPNEENKQVQYAYYSAGNSKIKYKHDDTSTAAFWWLRSPRGGSTGQFLSITSNGNINISKAVLSLGFAPGFCV